jgi:hypothetical protein
LVGNLTDAPLLSYDTAAPNSWLSAMGSSERSGFKDSYYDEGNQVRHAVMGLLVGYWAPSSLEGIIIDQERHQPPDQRLYEATFELGNMLRNGTNVSSLATLLKSRLCK